MSEFRIYLRFAADEEPVPYEVHELFLPSLEALRLLGDGGWGISLKHAEDGSETRRNVQAGLA